MSDVTVLNAPTPIGIEEIRRRAAAVLRAHGATRAIVIGSYARGTADAWSDIDLVVVVPTQKPFVERPLELLKVLDALAVPTDLLVYTPEEFESGMARGFGVFDAIRREGVQIL
ncbi:MAG TPA: nucleotidyltransferase domain-containing protein [Thermoanaerobaculia bacterium]|nr:nucleotidyltransferase domain-containing protein [Thermoanaerobaculia bacterium]